MDLSALLSGDLSSLQNPDQIKALLGDSNKLKQFLPILNDIADTFKNEDEKTVSAIITFEKENEDDENEVAKPILRLVATKEIEGGLLITRNVNAPTGDPIKIDLLDLLTGYNAEAQQ